MRVGHLDIRTYILTTREAQDAYEDEYFNILKQKVANITNECGGTMETCLASKKKQTSWW